MKKVISINDDWRWIIGSDKATYWKTHEETERGYMFPVPFEIYTYSYNL